MTKPTTYLKPMILRSAPVGIGQKLYPPNWSLGSWLAVHHRLCDHMRLCYLVRKVCLKYLLGVRMKIAIAMHEMIEVMTRIAIQIPFQFLSSSSATRSCKTEKVKQTWVIQSDQRTKWAIEITGNEIKSRMQCLGFLVLKIVWGPRYWFLCSLQTM